jgi:hypothetical protein
LELTKAMGHLKTSTLKSDPYPLSEA